MHCAKLGDLTIHYGPEGESAAPALVFCNSLGTDFRIWDELVGCLTPGLRIIRYDQRGHGLSDAGPGGQTIADLADDLAGLLDQLGVQRAVLVGLSVGGMIAQDLAARRLDLVGGLVLCCTGHKIGTADSWNARIAAVRQGGLAAIADGVLQRWFSPSFHRQRGAELALYRNMLVRTPVESYIATCAAIRDADLTDAARTLRVPTLCLAGSEDAATPPNLVEELARLIAGSQFHLLQGAAHIPSVEYPVECSLAINHFLGENRLV